MTDVTGILKKRGIASQAKSACWEAYTYSGASGMRYPIYDLDGNTIGHRWTCFTPEDVELAKGKYKWLPSKPKHELSNWYILPNTKQAISEAGGNCYLANGEKALLAYRAAGVLNVVATTHTESKVPDITPLKALGIRTLINIFDNDSAGEKGAIKWIDVCALNGIDYQMYRWSTDIPKADANDIWIASKFDTRCFMQALSQLIPFVAPKIETPKETYHFVPTADLAQRIAIALGLSGAPVNHNGYTKNFHCPMGTHEDAQPSAGLHMATGGVVCFACGTHSPRDVAQRLGIEVKERVAYKPKVVKSSNVKLSAPVPAPLQTDIEALQTAFDSAVFNGVWYPSGLTFWQHSVYNNIHHGDGQLTEYLNMLFADGTLNSECYTIDDLVQATGRNVKTIRSYMNRYAGVKSANATLSSMSYRYSFADLTREGRAPKCYRNIKPRMVDLLKLVSQPVKERVYKHTLMTSDNTLLDLTDNTSDEEIAMRREIARLEDAQRIADKAFIASMNVWTHRLLRDDKPMIKLADGWQHATTDEYTKLYLSARIAEYGELTISQQALGDELGIQANSVSRLLHKMDISIKANFDRFKVPTNIRGEQAVISASKQCAGRVVKFDKYMNAPSGEIFVRSYPAYENMGQAINKMMKEDANTVVYLVVQTANTYKLLDDEAIQAKYSPVQGEETDVNKAKKPNMQRKTSIIEGDIAKERKARKKRFWIPEIEDNDKVLYSSEFVARQALMYCYMDFNDKWQAVSKFDGRVIFDKVNFAVICYCFQHVGEFCAADYRMCEIPYDYSFSEIGEVVRTERAKSSDITLTDANGELVAIPF